ncbi:MAG: HTTM domain-containing protein [Bacteroidia bacterium]
MLPNYLFRRVDNAPLIFFRIAFGLLLAWHAFSEIFDGTVTKLYISPKYFFPFIGFEWVKPLPGSGMYWYFGIMGVAALGVALGLAYRYSLAVLTLLFTGAYLMQKVIYNNHHYLVLLLCLMLLIMPANRYASLDVHLNPKLKRYSMPNWCRLLILLQVGIVYFYAAVAKFYPGWIDGSFTGILMSRHRNPAHAFITQQHWFHLILAWGGLLFDLLIVPVLLYRRTRTIGMLAMLGFHLFNAMSLHIGIFPFLSLSMLCFFYPPDEVRRWVFPKKPPIPEEEFRLNAPANANHLVKYVLVPYVLIQLLLPLRHFVIPGNVFYTEEGHRLSWRMKLYHQAGDLAIYVLPKGNAVKEKIALEKYFLPWQRTRIVNHPDMLWQAAKYIKEDYAERGVEVAVYVHANVAVNRDPKRPIIRPEVNLAAAEWFYFSHCPWIVKNDE